MSCTREGVIDCHNAPSSMPYKKYKPWKEFEAGLPHDMTWPQRIWPSQRMRRAPRWCSVDLRDGNQALVNPMTVAQKLKYFRALVKMGLKEIEIGFPAASQLDFDFARLLIEKEPVPDDVWLMVLVQSREALIRRTIEAVKGAKKVIIHLYNSTSELQRQVVFQMSKAEIKQLAIDGTSIIRRLTDTELTGTKVRMEYSPESFTGTEVEFALDVCKAVMDVWKPEKENPIILNLPETVQNSPANFYADQIEWMHTHLGERRELCLISLHPHNDRGTGVASAELALLAGADRVEGCLFGNGERTGNVCLITLGVNLMALGIDPEMNVADLPDIIRMYEECTGLSVPIRHPWAGELVYTAFSGSHQDAIKKGLSAMQLKQGDVSWAVPYLPIDPKDLGRTYDTTVRINSQSGKGGVAFVMEHEFGIRLPRDVQIELSRHVQLLCDATAKEVSPLQVKAVFDEVFINPIKSLELLSFQLQAHSCVEKLKPDAHSAKLDAETTEGSDSSVEALPECRSGPTENPSAEGNEAVRILSKVSVKPDCQRFKAVDADSFDISGTGNGPIHAFVNALNDPNLIGRCNTEGQFEIIDYSEEAIGAGSAAEAICFVKVRSPWQLNGVWGVARHTNTTTASYHAIMSAINRSV